MTSLTQGVVGGGILKTDSLGRVRTDRTRREAILDEFERSGGSGAEFAAMLGIKYQTFATWIQARRRQRRTAQATAHEDGPALQAAPAMRWFETVVEKESEPMRQESALRVNLPGGAHVDIASAGQAKLAAQLLAHLGQRTA
ncbi:MAG TPA: IS66 family insertion sequence element accessory protein TnpB [Chthoniobacterales bacterium]